MLKEISGRVTAVKSCVIRYYGTVYERSRKNTIWSIKILKMNVHFIRPVTIGKRFPLLQTIEDIHPGLVRMYVTPYRIFWKIFISDLVVSYADKLLVSRCVQIVHILWPIFMPLALKKWGHICFGLSVCMYIYMGLGTSCMVSSWKNS